MATTPQTTAVPAPVIPPPPVAVPKSQQMKDYAVSIGIDSTGGKLATPEQLNQFYTYAQDQGFSNADVDNAFGFNAGTTDAWVQSNNKQPLNEYTNTAPPVAKKPGTTADGIVASQLSAPQQAIINGPVPTAQIGQIGQAAQIEAPKPVTAVTANVPYSQTSAGIVGNLLKEDGVYLQRARALADEESNARGLLSSSIAVGAATGAAIDRAGALATTDAGIYANQRLANMQAENEMANANANRSMQAAQFNAGAQNDFSMAQFQANTEGALQASGARQRLNELGLEQLMTMDQMKLKNEFEKDNLSLQTYLDMKKMGYGSTLNLSEMGYGAQLDFMKMAQGQGYDLEKMALSQGYTLDQMSAAFGFDLSKMAKGQEFDLQKLAVANGYDTEKMALDFGYRMQLQDAGMRLDADLRKDLATFTAQLDTSLTGRGTLANLAGRYADMFDATRRDPNLSAEDKATGLAQLRADFKSQAGIIADLYSLDATSYIDRIGVTAYDDAPMGGTVTPPATTTTSTGDTSTGGPGDSGDGSSGPGS